MNSVSTSLLVGFFLVLVSVLVPTLISVNSLATAFVIRFSCIFGSALVILLAAGWWSTGTEPPKLKAPRGRGAEPLQCTIKPFDCSFQVKLRQHRAEPTANTTVIQDRPIQSQQFRWNRLLPRLWQRSCSKPDQRSARQTLTTQ